MCGVVALSVCGVVRQRKHLSGHLKPRKREEKSHSGRTAAAKGSSNRKQQRGVIPRRGIEVRVCSNRPARFGGGGSDSALEHKYWWNGATVVC